MIISLIILIITAITLLFDGLKDFLQRTGLTKEQTAVVLSLFIASCFVPTLSLYGVAIAIAPLLVLAIFGILSLVKCDSGFERIKSITGALIIAIIISLKERFLNFFEYAIVIDLLVALVCGFIAFIFSSSFISIISTSLLGSLFSSICLFFIQYALSSSLVLGSQTTLYLAIAITFVSVLIEYAYVFLQRTKRDRSIKATDLSSEQSEEISPQEKHFDNFFNKNYDKFDDF